MNINLYICEMKKICTKCKEEKELSEFWKNKRHKDELDYNCILCKKEIKLTRRKYNKNYHKKYYKDNFNYLSDKNKRWAKINKDKVIEYQIKYYQKNSEIVKKRSEDWQKNNRDRINNKNSIRRKNDPIFRLKHNLVISAGLAFKRKGYSKTSRTQKLLGADYKTVFNHIEKQFYGGMSWENRSEWHIDHIIPLDSGNTKREIELLCHYTNLQPLWAKDNIVKSNTIPLVSQI